MITFNESYGFQVAVFCANFWKPPFSLESVNFGLRLNWENKGTKIYSCVVKAVLVVDYGYCVTNQQLDNMERAKKLLLITHKCVALARVLNAFML